ncbi:DUF1259 domain-containing protein [Bacillus xiapuensis]|uniref:DUF1259 domain-containing protein n=1 Tax=Bacillus xiapuensis TaxID=2014075 RepID=UPI000C24CE4E|nr:DUF1259 domain-containing protein [Bacillus xiapuensis]
MSSYQTLCQQFGQILQGKPSVHNGVCSVELKRDLAVTIQGRPSRAELHSEMMFESLDRHGHALNLGETVLLEKEVPAFVHALAASGLIISALHNHWLYAKPNILYVHFQSVEPPLSFARKVAGALRTLKT